MTLPKFYPILDTAALQRCGLSALPAAEALLTAGARILQLRHKGHFDRTLYADAQRIAAVCRDADALFVINDRVDIAMLLDAAVHVGQDDLPPSDTRKLIGPRRTVGFSTHNENQFTAADEPIDYVALGPIFGTFPSKIPIRGRHRGTEKIETIGASSVGCDRWHYACHRAGGLGCGGGLDRVVGDLYPDVRGSAEEWLSWVSEEGPGWSRASAYVDATTMVMGSMIGSGIFIVAADIARQVQSPGL